ncbi:ABC transporter permease [Acetonema longum]|uniref:Transport permease protein n=1 Tax=Acetonema longum DSM 6540 TaxID=1009370 RepID=F7NGD1_9FIRM|nr:ABC transporter permease [Acetonema longum]EGO64886.1 ABC-2 type transporter [Acetonema longum DSM 6540]
MIAAIRVLRRHMIVFQRTMAANAMYNCIEPLLYLSAMGFGIGAYISELDGISYMQFIATGMIASSAMFAASFECTYGSFTRMHFQKAFHAMLAAPVTVWDIALGEILYGAVKSVFFSSLILLLVTVLGQVSSWWALIIPLFLVLPGIAFALGALCFTGYITNIDYINYYITLGVTPLYLFSGIFFPVNTLPGWLQAVSAINPLYHTVEICRALALGRLDEALWLSLTVLAAYVVLLTPFVVRLWKKKLIV